jgi:hypothetical protein
MVAVQGENTVDGDDYQLKTSTFYEMSTYTLQKESNEVTVQYVGVVLDPLKPRVSCQDVLLPKGFNMENISRPWICFVYYYLKYCMEAEKRKNNITVIFSFFIHKT